MPSVRSKIGFQPYYTGECVPHVLPTSIINILSIFVTTINWKVEAGMKHSHCRMLEGLNLLRVEFAYIISSRHRAYSSDTGGPLSSKLCMIYMSSLTYAYIHKYIHTNIQKYIQTYKSTRIHTNIYKLTKYIHTYKNKYM